VEQRQYRPTRLPSALSSQAVTAQLDNELNQ
jgi:hypothetical protein